MNDEIKLQKYLQEIENSDENLKEYARQKWNSIAKPLYGMGLLEDELTKIIAILGNVDKLNKCVAVMCADNGIVEEGVTQTDNSVTAVVAKNITMGKATVTNMAEVAGAKVFAYDVGIATDVDRTIRKKVMYGTNNFLKTKAMERTQAIQTIVTGIEIVGELKQQGFNLIATGEMGIGNTTTSSAIASILLNVPAEQVTGRGAGLQKEQVVHKADVINRAIAAHNPDKKDMIDILSKVGGLDIAAMCGVFLGGAYYKVPIIIDGLISSVAALLAREMCDKAVDYMLVSHMSMEPASQMIMNRLDMTPPLNCHMALGEGTGAVALMPLLDMTLKVFNNMPTFKDINIEEYKPL